VFRALSSLDFLSFSAPLCLCGEVAARFLAVLRGRGTPQKTRHRRDAEAQRRLQSRVSENDWATAGGRTSWGREGVSGVSRAQPFGFLAFLGASVPLR